MSEQETKPGDQVIPQVNQEVQPAQTPDSKSAVETEEGTLLGGSEEAKTGEEVKETKQEVKPEVKEQVIPEKYEVKLPEGQSVDAELLNSLTPVFKELKLSQEGVQKLAEAYAPVVQKSQQMAIEAHQQQVNDAYKETVEGWKKEVVKEFGADYQKKVSVAAKIIDKFSGSPEAAKELKSFLNDTGSGNFPPLVKLFVNIGNKISEDDFVDATSAIKANQGINMNALYPSMKS